jgi:GNAT superfamily N-acetyltransferase
MAFETTSDGFALSDAPERFDLASGHAWIAGESYWAAGIPLATFEAAVRGSLTVGVYAPSGEMAAMARVVTDRATFAWICDVLVRESHRGQGLGKAIRAYLDVDAQQVVLGEAEAADGCLEFDPTVGPMPVVSVQPGHELSGSVV